MRRKRAGFSLAESLIAIAILALLSAGIMTVTAAVLSARSSMEEAAACQTLASNAILTIADEVRYGQNVRDTSEGICLDSPTYGENTRFVLTDGRLIAMSGEGSYELFSGSFYGALKISGLTIERQTGDSDDIKIEITAEGAHGAKYTASMSVTALNGIF